MVDETYNKSHSHNFHDSNKSNDPDPSRKMYDRNITNALFSAMQDFPVILLAGPHQVGKSELLRQTGNDYEWISFDNIHQIIEALLDPERFLMSRQHKLVLNHIERAPNMFPILKKMIDLMIAEALQKNQPEKCHLILIGIQSEPLFQKTIEIFGDQVAILPMQGLTYREQKRIGCTLPFVPDRHYLKTRGREQTTINDLWTMIHRGHLPKLITQNDHWENYYSTCVQTYTESQLKRAPNSFGMDYFVRFMTAVAARSGELVNYDSIARTVGISSPTAKRWLKVLEASGYVLLLQPFPSNDFRRMVKTPKMYFMDTGLMACLTRWLTPEALQKGAMADRFFETWVIGEIAKSYLNAGKSLQNFYFYRDTDQREIDLIIDLGDSIHPVDIQLTARPDKKMVQAFQLLEPLMFLGDVEIGDGAVINLHPKVFDLAPGVRAIPVGYL